MPLNPLEVRLVVDDTKANRDIDQFARDTGKKIDRLRLIELQAETGDLDLALFKLRRELSEIKKEGRDGVLNENEFKRVSGEIRETSSQLTEARRRLNNLRNTGDESVSRLQRKFDGLNNSVKGVLTSLVSLVSLREVGRGINNLADIADSFESGFAGFRKTLEATEGELKNIENGILELSKTIPLTTEELSKIAEVGGQFGIAADDILVFTETVAKLGTAIDGVQPENAARTLALLLGVTGEGIQNIDELGASLVRLGNNFRANEGEILTFANRLVASGSVLGLTSAEILGIATAFVDVGVAAERGGTSVQRLLFELNTAVVTGGENLEKLASIVGETSEEFRKGFEDDAASALVDFVEGLSNSGREADLVLQDLGLESQRLKESFLAVSSEGGRLAEAIEASTSEFANAIALEEEFNKRLLTNEAQLKIQSNQWRLYAASIGESVADSRVSVGEFALRFIPQVFSSVQLEIIRLANGWQRRFIAMQEVLLFFRGSLSSVAAFIADFGIAAATNADILGERFGSAFSNLPNILSSVFNSGIKQIEEFLNRGINGINRLSSLLGSDFQVGNISLGRIESISQARASSREFVSIQDTNRRAVAEGVQAEIDALATRRRVNEQSLINAEQRLRSQADLETNFREQAEKEVSDQIDGQIQEENKALQNYIDGLTERDDATGSSAKKQADAQKEIEQATEDFEKSAKSNYQEVGKAVDEVTKEIEDQESELQKLKDEYSQLKESAVEDIRGIKNELSTLDTEEDTQLAERRLEILARQAEIESEISDIRNSDDEDKSSQINALREEEIRLASEISLIESEVTQEILDQVEAYDQLSETQKILADNAKERAKIEEDLLLSQLLAEGRESEITIGTNEDGSLRAFVTDAEGIITEFTEFENIERAKSILADAQKRELEIANLETSIQTQTILQQDLINNLRFIEENYTSFIQTEYQKRTSAAQDYATNTIEAIRRIQDAARDANISIPSTSGTSSTSGGDTTNNITNNIEVNNATAGAAQVSTDTLLNNINTI